jgi:hypothetical protein
MSSARRRSSQWKSASSPNNEDSDKKRSVSLPSFGRTPLVVEQVDHNRYARDGSPSLSRRTRRTTRKVRWERFNRRKEWYKKTIVVKHHVVWHEIYARRLVRIQLQS